MVPACDCLSVTGAERLFDTEAGLPKTKSFSSSLHGEALLAARQPELQPLIDHLREVAQGRDDIRVECAGTIAGSCFSSAARQGEELVAGLLMWPGPLILTN
jgi:hypothetical protein